MTRFFRKAGLSLLILHSCSNISAQDTISKVHIGFTYPLSTNGRYARSYTNSFSFHALAGVSQSEQAFSFAGISNIIGYNARGFIFSGISNHIGNDAGGFVFAGITNHIGGAARGFRFAGISNHTRLKAEGLQFAGITNVSGTVKGVQIAGCSNICKDSVKGAQLAGLMNKAKKAGSQLAGFLNVATTVEGAQLAGFANISKEITGVEMAGFINTAKDVNGTQAAGFINIAGKVKGVQVSGFINIADSSEYPIGLINIIRHQGERTAGAAVDETGTLWGTFRSGSRKIYGILGIGHNPGTGHLRYGLEAGMGTHFPLGWFFRLNTEAVVLSWTDFEQGAYLRSSLRVLPSLRMGRNLEVFAGPTFNCSGYTSRSGGDPGLRYNWNKASGDIFNGFNIGALGGMQVHL